MNTTEDPERRVEEAREHLSARVEELGRRLSDAKDKLDIKAHIAAHPRLAVGIAFAAGALLGFPGKHTQRSVASGADAKSGLVGAAVATLGSLAFALVKSVAFHHLSEQAKGWWDQQHDLERDMSRSRDVESFLEH